VTTSELVRGEVAAQIRALVLRYGLSGAAASRLEVLLWMLADDPLASTTIRDPLRIVEDHLADSLVALELRQLRSASSVVDLGSGVGLPGLALAIALPEARFALVESAARKCAFLERLVAATEASNVEVVNVRAEAWPEGLGRFDLATARALAPLDVVAEYAAPLLRRGGTLLAWRGQREPGDEEAADRAAAVLGMRPLETVPVQPYSGARNRHLTLMLKEVETPPGFPRRPGIARKRPLGDPRRRAERETSTPQDASSARDV
jgi:16S rRNA (guanine527-N7)-methyltransferase